MIIVNTFVILVYRYYTYKFCKYIFASDFILNAYKICIIKITKVLPTIMLIDIYSAL